MMNEPNGPNGPDGRATDRVGRRGRTSSEDELALIGNNEAPAVFDGHSKQTQLNRQIVKILQEDGRASYAAIAEALGVAVGTVRNRVLSMQEHGLLRVIAVVDPSALNQEATTMFGIKVAAGVSPESVARRLGEHSEVSYIMWTSGRFDLLVEVLFDEKDALLEFMVEVIHDKDDIANCEMMVNLKMLKNLYLLRPDIR